MKGKDVDISNKNIWNYFLIIWVILWLSAAMVFIFVYGIETVAAFSVLLVPIIICGFLIPLLLFYNRSTLSLPYFKKRLLGIIPSITPERPKNIHYFCLVIIPLTCIFILYLIANPDAFIQYGPKYNENYSYGLALIHFFFLSPILGIGRSKNGVSIYTSLLWLYGC